jgi:predicted phosphodiesterase
VGGVLFLNPGSPTDKRYAPYNSVALLHVDDALAAEIVKLT